MTTDITLWQVVSFISSLLVLDGVTNDFEVTLKWYANVKCWLWRQLQ